MSKIKTYTRKPEQVEALQFILDETTKAEILAFCPGANVGLPEGDAAGTDIRWLIIPSADCANVPPGFFIVKDGFGNFESVHDEDFSLDFELVETAPAATEPTA